MTDDAEKARIAARDMAWEIKGDMGLPEEDYDELIEAFLQGQRHERERWKWVSCKERLPEIGKVVLCWAKSVGVTYGYYSDHFSKWVINDEIENSMTKTDAISFITHWQPLPEPPKEGQE